jgi:hypothetical protein
LLRQPTQQENAMAQDDSKADRPPTPSKKVKSPGQKVSRERGAATNHKKNPGKRPRQGGGSR